ncbi:MAG: hypothetical protein P1V81_07805 [Planctomycetota bacterium]|nr:hypothetical protein [Planctomycetota bacterium]
MSNARPAPALFLILVLVGVVIGIGIGFLFAPGQAPEARASDALLPTLGAAPVSGPGTSSQGSSPELPRGSSSMRDVAAAEAPGAISDARVAAAVRDTERPSVASSTGSGTIRGRVTDGEGNPIDGVTILAVRSSNRSWRAAKALGSDAPSEESLEDALDRAARSWASSRAMRRRQAADADGSYLLAGLEDAPYMLSAYKEGWVLRAVGSSTLHPGEELNFRGTQTRGVTLDLRLPDGSVPDDVMLEVTTGDRPKNYSWSPDEPTLAITSPRFTLRALAGIIDSPIYFRETPSRYASAELSVDVDQQGVTPLVVQLEPRRGVFGRVRRAWPTSDNLQVAAVPVTDAASFDPNKELEDVPDASTRAGEYMVLDLEPGLHAIGLQSGGRQGEPKFSVYELVTVVDGLVEVDLVEPEPVASEHLVVRCLDEAGRLLDDVSFTRTSRSGGGSRSGSTQVRQAPDGSYWFDTGSLCSFDFDSWPKGASITLTGSSTTSGKQTVELSSGQRELTMQFARPLSLEVVIAGYAGSSNKDEMSVHVNLVSDTDDGWGNSMAQSKGKSGWGNGPKISDEGVVVFHNLSPGLLEVELLLGDGWRHDSSKLDSVEVNLAGADASVQLSVPMLHDLLVLAPDLGPETFLNLSPKDDDNPFSNRKNQQLDASGRATFTGLTPGIYMLAGGGGAPLEVQVPSSEVVYQPKLPIGLRVVITNEEGGLFQAGLREGDVILSTDGNDLAKPQHMNQFYQVIAAASVDLVVLRGGSTTSLSLGPLQLWGGGSLVGGQLTPHYE